MGEIVPLEQPKSEAEAAEWLGVHKTTLQRERRAGKITARKFRGRYFYMEADLAEYVERQRVPACAEKIAPPTSECAGSRSVRTASNGAQPGIPEAAKLHDYNPFAPATSTKRTGG